MKGVSMFKNKEVQKFFFIARISAGLALGFFWPLWFLFTCTSFSPLEAVFVYVILVIAAQIGLFLFVSVWNKFEIKEATTEQ